VRRRGARAVRRLSFSVRSGGRVIPVWLGLLAAAACADSSGQDTLVHLRVATAPWLAFAPLHVAMAEGYFRQAGLEVELVRMAGTEIAVPLLIDESIDVLPGNLAPGVLNAIARGARIRLVGKVQDPVTGGCSSISILARPGLLDSAAGRVAPTSVQRISLNRQVAMRYLADVALASMGVALDSLEVVDIPTAAQPEALASGAVDAALAGEPFLSRTLQARKGDVWIPIVDVIPDAEVSLLFFGRRLLEEDREAGVRFLAAYQRALRQLAEGKTERNVALIAEATGDDPELIRQACLPFGPTDGRVRMASVMRFQEWAARRGLLDQVVPADVLWDSTFIERANRSGSGPP